MENTPKNNNRKPFLMKPLDGETKEQFKARLRKQLQEKEGKD